MKSKWPQTITNVHEELQTLIKQEVLVKLKEPVIYIANNVGHYWIVSMFILILTLNRHAVVVCSGAGAEETGKRMLGALGIMVSLQGRVVK